ncbi:hypothetical protein PFISCL1PPCAC_5371, partial [Pristionchus fissidentatus]
IKILAKVLTIINIVQCIPAIKAAYNQEDIISLGLYLVFLLYLLYAVFRMSSGLLIPVFVLLGIEIARRLVEFLSTANYIASPDTKKSTKVLGAFTGQALMLGFYCYFIKVLYDYFRFVRNFEESQRRNRNEMRSQAPLFTL